MLFVKVEELKAAVKKDRELGMVLTDAFCEIIDTVPTYTMMEAGQISFGQGINPSCPNCRSEDYITNKNGNRNNFCGKCGKPLRYTMKRTASRAGKEGKYEKG